MQVWMITGDKQETAINIAVACKLVHHIKDLLIVNAHQSEDAAKARLQELLAMCKQSNPNAARGSVSVQVSFCPVPAVSLLCNAARSSILFAFAVLAL